MISLDCQTVLLHYINVLVSIFNLAPVPDRLRVENSILGKIGYLDILDILDAQRTLIQLEADYLDALATFHTAASEVEQLIAQPLDNVLISQLQEQLP